MNLRKIMTDLPVPHMTQVCCNALTSALGKCETYLEFGMGGSTTLAARLGVPNIVSVDSSKDWVANISAQIATLEIKGRIQLLHANIGTTGDWGYPIDSSSMVNWPSYYSGPWATVKENALNPDLVLIDGRFRVACFLYSLLNLNIGSTILWDDYKNRPEYHVVEKYLTPSDYHDNMAVFKVGENKDVSGIVSQLFAGLYLLD
jgi:hypothetical protein